MKITVLGSGGFGYPLVFCNCEYCRKARKLGGRNIRKRASLLINDEMIIDLTPDCQCAMNMYNKDMGKTKYLLQTHTHLDHFDLNQFITLDYRYSTNRKEPLTLICSDLCLQDIQNKVDQFDKMYLYDSEYLDRINLKINTINHGDAITVGDYEIKAIHCLHHENIGAQLYLIKQGGKAVLYATDTPQISDIALGELAGEKIDCVFLDESFGVKNYQAAHLNIEKFDKFVQILKQNKLLSQNYLVYATHITHDGNPPHEELNAMLGKFGYEAAYDGMEFKI